MTDPGGFKLLTTEAHMQWYWHIHHDILLEPVIGSIEERIRVIQKEKPVGERETRLRVLRPVQHVDRLPRGFVEARKAYDEARKAYDEAWKAYVEARKECDEELAALHREECPGCPWNGYELVFF